MRLALHKNNCLGGVLRFIPLLLLLVCGVAGAVETSVKDVRLTMETNVVLAKFDPRSALGAGIDGHAEGECLQMLGPQSVRQMLGAGLGPISVRLRTELAVEAWHWNPKGKWSDVKNAQGYWISEAKPDSATPILLSYGYKLPRRGDTLDEANDDGYSMLDDGDPKTFWKSNPYLTKPYTGELDSHHSQWVVLDFGKPVPINEIRIQWGEPYAKQFVVEYATKGRVYFGGHPWNVWKHFPHGTIEQGRGGDQDLRLSQDPIKARYLRIWMTEGSGTIASQEGHQRSRDQRDSLGYAIREISAGVHEATGIFHDAVSHAPGHEQTVTYASSTDPWHKASDRDPKVEQPGIDLLARCGITRNLPMMLAVPVLYDTPENASALVRYVEGKKIPISRYELGEEPDGQRVAPEDFGALYAQVSRRIRKEVLQGILGGPSFVTVDVDRKDDETYRFDKRWWIRDFRRELADQEEGQNFQFLSFEWYPFDDVFGKEAEQLPKAYEMLERAMKRLRPLGLPLVIGEANYSVFPCQQEVDLGGALLNTEIAAQFLCKGGATHYYYGYEPNTLDGSSGSWGNQMMLMDREGQKRAVPLATFHALRLLTHEWMNSKGGEHQALRVKSDLSAPQQNLLSAFLLKRPEGKLSLLLINKDPSHALQISFGTSKIFSSLCHLTTYSANQYLWKEDASHGNPVQNDPPCTAIMKTGQFIIIPPWSISVLRDR